MNITAYLQSRPTILKKIFGTDISQFSFSEIQGKECDLVATICGKDGGCLNTFMDMCLKETGCHYNEGGYGYQCFCDDLEPVDLKTGSCDRNETNTGMPEIPNPDSTLATFGEHQLMKMFSPGNNGTSLIPILITNQQNVSKDLDYQHIYSNINFISFNPFVLSIVVLITAFLLSSLGIYYCYKRIRRMNTRKLNQIPLTGTLSKCMQQYVTNPNYYASSPDAPMIKMLQEITLCEEDITFGEEIGEGCFGTVFKGTYKQSDATIIEVAIKVLKDKNEAQEDFEREIEIISSFNHINIIQLIGIIMKDTNSIPYMVFEYMKYGDLAELLRSKKCIRQILNESIDESMRISHEDLIWISTQIANGCKYLADNHFVHRDLATRNCLVGHNLTVKISDFGMSRDIYTCDYYKVGGSKLLPVRWMSPESILYGKFTLESDVWSFGVILWEIYTLGKQPYFGHNNEEVVKLILQGILLIPPDDCPKCIYELMAGCWKTEPRDRINFSTILNQLMKNCTIDKQKLLSSDIKIIDEEIVDGDNYLVPNHSTSFYSTVID